MRFSPGGNRRRSQDRSPQRYRNRSPGRGRSPSPRRRRRSPPRRSPPRRRQSPYRSRYPPPRSEPRRRSPPRRERIDPTRRSKFHNTDIARGTNRELDDRSLYVRGLPFDASENDIMNHRFFRKATGIRLIVDKPNRKSHGFCFICFENVQACDEAFKNRDELSFAGRKLMVDYIG